MTLQDLYEEHREIFRLGERLIEVAAFDPPHVSELIAARRAIAQAVARHLGNEARLALMPLGASTDPYHRALARRYTSDLLSMRQSGIAHMGRWTTENIAADPREYRLAVRAQMPSSRNGALRPGMFARVLTVFSVDEAALVVPEEAIVPQAGLPTLFAKLAERGVEWRQSA